MNNLGNLGNGLNDRQLRALLRSLPRTNAPADLEEKLMQRISNEDIGAAHPEDAPAWITAYAAPEAADMAYESAFADEHADDDRRTGWLSGLLAASFSALIVVTGWSVFTSYISGVLPDRAVSGPMAAVEPTLPPVLKPAAPRVTEHPSAAQSTGVTATEAAARQSEALALLPKPVPQLTRASAPIESRSMTPVAGDAAMPRIETKQIDPKQVDVKSVETKSIDEKPIEKAQPAAETQVERDVVIDTPAELVPVTVTGAEEQRVNESIINTGGDPRQQESDTNKP